jgi:hypothetical protein
MRTMRSTMMNTLAFRGLAVKVFLIILWGLLRKITDFVRHLRVAVPDLIGGRRMSAFSIL